MSERIAFIGFGEAGQTIGRGLAAQGAQLRAYDILFDDPADKGRLKEPAAAMRVAGRRMPFILDLQAEHGDLSAIAALANKDVARKS